MMRTEQIIRDKLEELIKNIKHHVDAGDCDHGTIGEISGMCSRIEGNIDALKWVLGEIED